MLLSLRVGVGVRKMDSGRLLMQVLVIVLLLCAAAAHESTASEVGRRSIFANGIGQTPPMGWNSWNHFQCHIDECVIRETADALVSTGLANLGYHYVNIDDCWAELNRDDKICSSFFFRTRIFFGLVFIRCAVSGITHPRAFGGGLGEPVALIGI